MLLYMKLLSNMGGICGPPCPSSGPDKDLHSPPPALAPIL